MFVWGNINKIFGEIFGDFLEIVNIGGIKFNDLRAYLNVVISYILFKFENKILFPIIFLLL